MMRRRAYNISDCYAKKSGTSMATPIVTGAVALLLSAYPNLTNKEVKICIRNSARNLGFPHAKQGWGMLDIAGMLEQGKMFTNSSE